MKSFSINGERNEYTVALAVNNKGKSLAVALGDSYSSASNHRIILIHTSDGSLETPTIFVYDHEVRVPGSRMYLPYYGLYMD